MGDRATLTGTWTQRKSFPLVLTRASLNRPAPAHEIQVEIPLAPTAFRGGNKTHLVYELRITNAGPAEVKLVRVDVLGNGTLASFMGAGLKPILPETRIMSGSDALAYMWVTIDDHAPVPKTIRHKLTFDQRTFEGAEAVVATQPLPVLSSPLRGEGWMAANGPGNAAGLHRRALARIGGHAYIAQRLAIDWLRLGPNGNDHSGNPKENKNYYSYGAEVLAVTDAVVSATKDGIPQNVPGEHSRAIPITRDTIGGNYIILDLGQGRYAFYAHLQPGSLRVKTGDRVGRGQVLALVGNSGNATAPHLHFHVTDRNSPLESEGVPYVLESFEVRGKGNKYEKREKQVPMSDEIVRFP